MTYTTAQFQAKINQRYPNEFKILSSYQNWHTPIWVKHIVCQRIFKITPAHLITRGRCTLCSKFTRRASQQMTQTDFEKRVAKKQNNRLEILSPYMGQLIPVLVRCRICGQIFKALPHSLLYMTVGLKHRHINAYTPQQLKNKVEKISHGKITLLNLSEIKDTHTRATFHCNKCGLNWKTLLEVMLSQHTGCPYCHHATKGEQAVRHYLDKHHYVMEYQYQINNCRSNVNAILPFDFAVFNKDGSLNCLIEYEGQQHFYTKADCIKSQFFFTWKNIKILKEHDRLKAQYCKRHNIKLICINHPRAKYPAQTMPYIQKQVNQILDKELRIE